MQWKQVDDFVTCMKETPRFLEAVIAHDVNAAISICRKVNP